MAEHWKSTPKYYCTYCATYVRDSKLERTNHELTGKHKGAVSRKLRDIHRATNTEGREKERARREIDRLNGVVNNNNNNNNTAASAPKATASGAGGAAATAADLNRQAMELAEMGVEPPEQFRAKLAKPGEWVVTSTTVVKAEDKGEGYAAGLKAKGWHKRARTEDEQEHEEAVNILNKKPRRWGRMTGGEASEELDALLSGGLGLVVDRKEETSEEEIPAKTEAEDGAVKEEVDRLVVKKEPSVEPDAAAIPAEIPVAGVGKVEEPSVKTEDGQAVSEGADIPVVAFKKRKPKNIRQK